MPTVNLLSNGQTLALNAESPAGSVVEADLSGIITVPQGSQLQITDIDVASAVATSLYLVYSTNFGGSFSRLREILFVPAIGTLQVQFETHIPINGIEVSGIQQVQIKWRFIQAVAGRVALGMNAKWLTPR